jgi:recombination protein RecT
MSNELAKPVETRLEVLLKSDTIKKRFDEVLGKKAAPFISSVISAYKSNKALSECEPMSVMSAALQAATLDLPINQSLGMAHIVPYSGVAQFQLGWKGLVQLAQRTGLYETMHVTEIYEGQVVSADDFTGEYVFQEPKLSNTVIGYLFYFKLTSGFRKQIYWSKDKVEKHAKRYSKTYAKGIGRWKEDFDAMAKKTVVIDGLSKWGPKSVEFQAVQQALIKDQGVIDVETGEVKSFPDNPEPERQEASTTSERLGQVIEAVAETVTPKPHDSSKDKVWKDKITVATNLHDLNEILKQIPESEQSPEISEHYSACYKMLASAKASKK